MQYAAAKNQAAKEGLATEEADDFRVIVLVRCLLSLPGGGLLQFFGYGIRHVRLHRLCVVPSQAEILQWQAQRAGNRLDGRGKGDHVAITTPAICSLSFKLCSMCCIPSGCVLPERTMSAMACVSCLARAAAPAFMGSWLIACSSWAMASCKAFCVALSRPVTVLLAIGFWPKANTSAVTLSACKV